MNVLVFKTNIQNRRMADCLEPVFSCVPVISEWSVDTEDCDKILRIETNGILSEEAIIDLVTNIGIACEALEDNYE